ncbi:hypothetical protein BX616_005981, partial [Lobosporangium transversale]
QFIEVVARTPMLESYKFYLFNLEAPWAWKLESTSSEYLLPRFLNDPEQWKLLW